MPEIQFGFETTCNERMPTQSWFPCKAARDSTIEGLVDFFRRDACNDEVRIRKLLRLEDGTVHVELGPSAVHVQWRPTVLQTEDAKRPRYRRQAAIVDVLSGQVLVTDSDTPFAADQHEDWSRRPCLVERLLVDARGNTGGDFVAELQPTPGHPSGCQYAVKVESDLPTLRTKSRPHARAT